MAPDYRDCELLPGCKFFSNSMTVMPICAEEVKARYCKGGDFPSCARYRVFKALGQDYVTPDLFPNLEITATEIIQKNMPVRD